MNITANKLFTWFTSVPAFFVSKCGKTIHKYICLSI